MPMTMRMSLPRAGGRTSPWGPLPTGGWKAAHRKAAFGLDASRPGGKATISSCFYLLVKYSEVTPKSFICKGDAGTTEFKLSEMTGLTTNFELIDAWDFGPSEESFKHCSYAYHVPFGTVCADDLRRAGLGRGGGPQPVDQEPGGRSAQAWSKLQARTWRTPVVRPRAPASRPRQATPIGPSA